MNHSPWIAQLRRTRPVEPLEGNRETDVVIVGGGIAGVSTAYFLLKHTDKRIVLLEGYKIAHGATGHNAGQVSSYYEKRFVDLVREYGETKAAHAQRIIEEHARVLFEEIFSHTGIDIPRSEFIGYHGCVTEEHVMAYLEDLVFRAQAGLRVRPVLIAREWLEQRPLPEKYLGYYVITPQQNILQLLETQHTAYVAAYSFLSGCINSALFTEELAAYMLAEYPDRFVLREHTLVSKIILAEHDVAIETDTYTIAANEVVLCTNGFEGLSIVNHHGSDIDGAFHHEVHGIVGYMAGYKEPLTKPPFASSYAHADRDIHDHYSYVTRRPFEDESSASHNLICVGGPESFIPDRAMYDSKKPYPLPVSDEIDTFMMQTYKSIRPMDYQWHGLMGYTTSGVRLIGREVKNPRLLYNLGCNGVGILTSVYGGERIARIINKEIVEPTIFDPQ